jgi:MATE family multidrug resistance protein
MPLLPSAVVRREAGALLRLASPLILGQIATVAMNFVDTVMAGRLSAEALGAVAVGGAIWGSLLLFTIGTMMVVSPMVAQLVGAEAIGRAPHVVRQSGWIALALSALAIFVMTHVQPIFGLLHAQPEIVPTAIGYLRALAWGVPGLALYLMLRYLSEGMAHTRPVLYFGVIGLAVNVAANYILIYGKLGFPALGAVGCGYATAIVFWVQGLGFALYVSTSSHYAQVQPVLRFEAPDLQEIGELLRVGLPIGVSIFLESSLFSGVALLMASLGTAAVAGHQVALNFLAITFMVPLGIAMAITVRVGQAAGRGDGEGIRRSGWTGISLALSVQVITGIVLLTVPRKIAAIYTSDPAVLDIAAGLLVLAAVFQLSDGLQVSASGALRGLKDTRVPMWITLIAYWGVGLPLGYTLGLRLGLGPRGMWVGLIGGLTTAAALLVSRFRHLARRLAQSHPGVGAPRTFTVDQGTSGTDARKPGDQ